MISLFYQEVYKECGSVACSIAFGEVSKGKTNAIKLALAACANYPNGYVTHLTESTARAYLSAGIPFAYDDPNDDVIVRSLLMNSFGGATMAQNRVQVQACCTPLITTNRFIVEQLTAAEERFITKL